MPAPPPPLHLSLKPFVEWPSVSTSEYDFAYASKRRTHWQITTGLLEHSIRNLCQHHAGAQVSLEHLPQWAAYRGVSIYELPWWAAAVAVISPSWCCLFSYFGFWLSYSIALCGFHNKREVLSYYNASLSFFCMSEPWLAPSPRCLTGFSAQLGQVNRHLPG